MKSEKWNLTTRPNIVLFDFLKFIFKNQKEKGKQNDIYKCDWHTITETKCEWDFIDSGMQDMTCSNNAT